MAQTQSTPHQFSGIAGRRVLITGASSGLGAHFARLFAAMGSHVIAAARRTERVKELTAEIKAQGGTATALSLDVSVPGAVQQTLNGLDLDIVIDNAGTTLSASAFDHSAAAIDNIIDTNLKGVFMSPKPRRRV